LKRGTNKDIGPKDIFEEASEGNLNEKIDYHYTLSACCGMYVIGSEAARTCCENTDAFGRPIQIVLFKASAALFDAEAHTH
jgi:hypothetical protein